MKDRLPTIWKKVKKPLKVIVSLILIFYFSIFANLHDLGWAPKTFRVEKAFATATLNPASDGTYTAWTPQGGGAHYVEVNDANDATYVSTNTAGNRDSYGLTSGLIPSGAKVTQIQVYARAMNVHGSKDSTFKIFYRHSAVDTDGVQNNPPNGSYQDYSETWSGLNWTDTDIDALEIGVYLDTSAPGSSMNVSKVYVVVSYYVIQNLQTDCTGQNCNVYGQTFNISATMNNQTTANVSNSNVDYTVYIDDNPADSQPSPNEGYADRTAADCDTWQATGASTDYSHRTSSFNVNAGVSQGDSWQCENTYFPSITTYSIYAVWHNGAGTTYDTLNVTFASVPTLDWWLLTLFVLLAVYFSYQQGYLSFRLNKGKISRIKFLSLENFKDRNFMLVFKKNKRKKQIE